jgi:uncharacterized membrane protein YesL
MAGPGRVLWRTLRMAWEDMFTLVVASAIWTVVALAPAIVGLVVGGPLVAVLALLLTLPPATAGLYFVTNRLAHDRVGSVAHIVEGARRYSAKAWLFGLINLGVSVIGFTNFQFYNSYDAPWMVVVRAVWAAILITWGWSQLYAFPLLIEQEQPSVVLALRNSLVLAFTSPALTIMLTAIVISLILVLLVFFQQVLAVLPALLLLPSVWALLTNVAVVQRLKVLRGETETPDAD